VEETVFTYMKKVIRDEMNVLADAMATGQCHNMEEYRQMVGKVEGLAWVERELIDLEEKIVNA
jgi:hypothetical protein